VCVVDMLGCSGYVVCVVDMLVVQWICCLCSGYVVCAADILCM